MQRTCCLEFSISCSCKTCGKNVGYVPFSSSILWRFGEQIRQRRGRRPMAVRKHLLFFSTFLSLRIAFRFPSDFHQFSNLFFLPFFPEKKNFSSSYISLLPSTQTSMTKELQQPKITCAHLNHFHRINPPPSFPHNFS